MQHGFYNNYQTLDSVKSFDINFNNRSVRTYKDANGMEWYDIWDLCYALNYARFTSHPSGEYRSPQFYNMLSKRCGDKPVKVFKVIDSTRLCVSMATLEAFYNGSRRNYNQRKMLSAFLNDAKYRIQATEIVLNGKTTVNYDNIRLQIEQLKNEYQARVIKLLRKEFNV